MVEVALLAHKVFNYLQRHRIQLIPTQVPFDAEGRETGRNMLGPGKLWQNGDDDSFNGKIGDECLSMEWFRTGAEANAVIEA